MPKIKTIPLLELIFKNNLGGTSDIWKTISELLHYKEDEISVFIPYIKNKINSYNKETSLLALTLLDYCVDDGRMILWSALNTKNFLESIIHNLKTRKESEIQNMILYLLQKWGKKFADNNELLHFQNIYKSLKNNNISFPNEPISDYNKYVKLNKSNNNINNNKRIKKNNNNIIVETDPENYLKDINIDLNTSSYDKIYKRLVNKLYDWTHAIHEVNVLINKNNDGRNNKQIEGLCKDLSKGNKQLIETIESGRLKDTTLMEISLNVTDDINMSLERWNNNKNGKYPGPFVSSFLQTEEWRNKILNNNMNNSINNNSNYNNINNFYNINNSTFNNNTNNNSMFNNNINQFNNNTNNFNLSNNPELQKYPKLYDKLRESNINNYQIKNNYQNNNISNSGINNNINNQNNNNNSNKQGSFNLLIDFESEIIPPKVNNNTELNLNLNDKNNMDKFVDFVAMTEKLNNINNNNNYNNNMNNKYEKMKNNNLDNRKMSNNNLYDDENKDDENPYIDRKFSNDNNTSKINKSMMYPSFEELEESNSNNNTNQNSNQNQKESEDILSKFDF